MKYFPAQLALLLFSALSVGAANDKPFFKQVIAHRGEHIECPGNTMPAILRAFELGVDGVEIDVRLTKDGVVVLCHNPSVEHMTGIDKNVVDLTYAELRQLDFGFTRPGKWTGTKIASLQEVLAALPSGKFLHIEMKASPETLLTPLINTVKESGLGPEQIKFTSGNFHSVAGIEKELPEYETFWNGYKDPQKAKDAGIDGIAAYFKETHAKQVLETGLLLRIGQVNNLEIAKKVRAVGVEIVDTDKPATMVPLLK